MAKVPGLQRHLHINKGNTIATRATMLAQGQQRSLRIDDGNVFIVTRAGRQLDDYASLTMAEMLLQQGQQSPSQQW
jgi:hypothetical protein